MMQQSQTITLTKAALFKYTMCSLFFALLALFFVILPAEYNIDPSGVGQKLGLTVFNNVKAQEPLLNSSPTAERVAETIEVIVPAGKGVEYKFTMQQYQKMEYQWETDGSTLYFDLHGEPEGDTTGYFESYAIATLTDMSGSFTAPFSGVHGWYWKNKTDKPVTVQLTVKGNYQWHGLK